VKALRFYGGKDMRLEDVPEPAPGPGEVKIRVKWCGICGSDVHEYLAGPLLLPVKAPHPLTRKKAPLIGGHEFAGEVVQVDVSVKNTQVGDRVTVRPTIPCYQCFYCKQGRHIQCVMLGTIGGARDGAYAEFVVVPEDNVYKMPPPMTYETGTFTEPLACGVHAVKRSRMEPGCTVAVIGAGPIGLLTMQAALACGAAKAIVFETLPHRSRLAKDLGAAEVIDPTKTNPGKAIAELTEGRRAEIVFECAGPPAAMLLADTISGRGATIVEVGFMVGTCDFPFQNIFMREKTIVASQGYVDEFPAAISLLAGGKVRCDPLMISSKIKLEEILEKGILELLSDRRMEHCKILVTPA
jgi:(R,R)-butanediol dehydrogenase / meso-butanediol dehydrogenase / diacetyl reductase